MAQGKDKETGQATDQIVDVEFEKLDIPDTVRVEMEKGTTVLILTGENEEQYYFKKPGQADMNRFLGTSSKGKLAVAVRNLVYDMAIHPSTEDLKRQFRGKPGRVVALNNALQTEIGLNEDYTVKKL